MEEYVDIILKGLIIFSSCLIFILFIRAVIGPTITDRLMAVNMIGTQVIIIIAELTVLLDEVWLADIGMVYALISFLGVVVLTKIYIGIYRKEHPEMFENKSAAVASKVEPLSKNKEKKRKRRKNG
ncbi:MAG: sodium:proton antiporter [Lachnospiraceae bacterium]|nr:sodium:proton antiporter [Lachnospiraceae bacterium]